MSQKEKLKMASGVTCLFLLLSLYGFFLCHKTNLVTADLGRHIKNGELVFKNPKVLTTNFYSYTQPDFPTINHHWLSGAVFYFIWKFLGFFGLSFFYIFLSLFTFLIFLKIAKEKSNPNIAALVSLFLIPLFAERTEVRPEIFTYFFASVFFYILTSYQQASPVLRRIFLLPFLEILWANLHIYFFVGPLLVAIFLVKKRSKELLEVFVLTLVATAFTPFGPTSSFAPLTIFKNYGYRLVENQPVWVIEKLIFNPNFLIFKIVFFLTALSFILALLKKNFSFINLVLFSIFGLMSWLSIRNFTLFGYFVLPIFSTNLNFLFAAKTKKYEDLLNIFIPILTASCLLLAIILKFPTYFPYWRQFGLGLETGNNLSADFLKNQKIQGPIFNNYDVGGYLIFHLFPDQKVFVDNRPEAYSVDFFQKIYIPMQDNEKEWKKLDEIYNFNAIFFSYHEATSWGQKFLVNRIRDPNWTPVFVDQYALILLKRKKLNWKIIEKYEIPKERFKIIKNL